MAYSDGLRLKLLLLVLFFGMISIVIGLECQHSRNRHQLVVYAAQNRVLRRFAYAKKHVRSAVICGRDCSVDKNCKSINFDKNTNICELNNATRDGHADDFFQDQGSVYFDENEDTPLFSVAQVTQYESCLKLYEAGFNTSGVFTIYPSSGFKSNGLQVFCDMGSNYGGAGWIVFQRRQDGSVDFYRNWTEYQSGFGNLSGEFWLGNDNLVVLTTHGTWELRVDIGDWEGNTAWAKYTSFQITGEKYTLRLGQYDAGSTAGDSLGYHRDNYFSTKDRDNDGSSSRHCAQKHLGGFWFNRCANANLNGYYYVEDYANPGVDEGVEWYEWKNMDYSMKNAMMKIRETDF